MGRTFLEQRVNTYLSMLFVGVFAFGAAYLIVSVANQEQFAIAPQTELPADVPSRGVGF